MIHFSIAVGVDAQHAFMRPKPSYHWMFTLCRSGRKVYVEACSRPRAVEFKIVRVKVVIFVIRTRAAHH